MNHKVYLLLDVVDGRDEQVVQVLRKSPGVVMADALEDALEDSPKVVVVIEAPERKRLAKWTIEALSSVETLTEQVRLLPTREESNRIVTKLRPSR